MAGFVTTLPLFAQAPNRPTGVFQDPQTWMATGLLVLVLLAGALALFILERWRKRQFGEGDTTQESAESLTSFRALYERGELSKEEYERVRHKMAAKIKQEVLTAQPSAAQPVVRPTSSGAEPGGPTNGGDFAPGADSPTGPETGSSNS
jgi:hypothetical protein